MNVSEDFLSHKPKGLSSYDCWVTIFVMAWLEKFCSKTLLFGNRYLRNRKIISNINKLSIINIRSSYLFNEL